VNLPTDRRSSENRSPAAQSCRSFPKNWGERAHRPAFFRKSVARRAILPLVSEKPG
jgi:hypothetical protein